jgi:hypothetical protein
VGVAACRAPFTPSRVQLPGEKRIKRLVAFAEAHGVFADYRDHFSLLDKIKQVFPESSVPIGLIRSRCRLPSPRGAGFSGKLTLESKLAAPSAGATMFALHKEFRVASTITGNLGIKFLKL